jgi:prepilin-type processing-associated H-X9-DG protein
MCSDSHNRPGVSKTGVMVVFVVLAVMLALAVPAILAARESARKTACRDNLEELGLGLSAVATVNGCFPAGTVVRKALPPEKRLSWYVGSSPYFLPQEWVVVQMDQPWDSPVNLKPKLGFHQDIDLQDVHEEDLRRLDVARCPSTPSFSPPELPDVASYIGIAGLGGDAPRLPGQDPKAGIWGYDRCTRPDDIKNGLGSTMLLAETAFQNGPWTAGGAPTVRGIVVDAQPLMGTDNQLGGIHPGGANVLFADSSVRFIGESVERQVLAGMATIAGRDVEANNEPK